MEKIANTPETTQVENELPQVADSADMYIDLISELYRIFDFFNKHFCSDAPLPRPIITVASKSTHKNALGWFSARSWKDKGGKIHNEINICAEHMSRNIDDILETVLHEMAHLKNSFYGIKDVANRRHNKKFKEAAEFFGLIVADPHDGLGYAYTSLGDAGKEAIKLVEPNEAIFGAFRDLEKEAAKRGPLRPIMVSIEYKDTVTAEARNRGMSQKEFAEAAIDYYLEHADSEEEDGE